MSEIKWTHEFIAGEFAVMIDDVEGYGYFEHDRLGEEGGAGGLWFKGKELVDYDGVWALNKEIATALRERGYEVSWTCVDGEDAPDGKEEDDE